jgi:hypothetical protein
VRRLLDLPDHRDDGVNEEMMPTVPSSVPPHVLYEVQIRSVRHRPGASDLRNSNEHGLRSSWS